MIGGTLSLWPVCSGLEQACAEVPSLSSIPFPLVLPKLCVAIAPIGDLLAAHLRQVSDDGKAVEYYLKALPEYEDEGNQILSRQSPFRLASPKMLLPLRTRTLIVAGTSDFIVPLDLIKQFYYDALQAAEECDETRPELLLCEEANHFQLVDATTSTWHTIYAMILQLLSIES
jgi:pimeloyl-ACP methyl ester carboxylesterase